MNIQKLIAIFSRIQKLPVEITDVREKVISMGIQDNICFCPDASLDSEVLRGIYYQYTRRDGVYGETELCSLIIYSINIPVEWQRLVCCKELIHILDRNFEATSKLDELDGLLKRLLGPLSTEDFNIFDIMATKDRLALYQAIPVLFPTRARNDAIKKLNAGKTTLDEIVEKACLPKSIVSLALREDWPGLIKDLCL